MGRPSWATAEQRSFIETFRAAFYEAQRTRTHRQFWGLLYEKWHAKYPPRDPNQAELDYARLQLISKEAFDISEEYMKAAIVSAYLPVNIVTIQ